MLELLFSVSSLMILPMFTKLYWHIIMLSLSLLTMKHMISYYSSSMMMITNNFMTDSLSLTLTTLSLWITMLMMLASYKTKNMNNKSTLFTSTCLFLLLTLILSFNSSSMLTFYIAFEASLIPTMMLIMLWGYQPERIQASVYLMMYTITASLPLLLMILYIHSLTKSSSWFMLSTIFPTNLSTLFWILIITAFLVKLPMFLVHLWLPKAHVEAPIAGSMILAAILLKLGGYGVTRMIMIFSYLNKTISPLFMSVSLIGGVITSMICLRQSDMKSLIAYSSIGHMALMLAGALTGTKMGMQASLSMMLAHGLSSSAMFCLANMTYNITMTRSITLTKGLLSLMPAISFWWFIGCCANMATPPSINLMSEIFLIAATMSQSFSMLLPLALISFMTVAYSLYLYSASNHGHNMSLYNPTPHIAPSDMLLISLHMIPVFMLILKPEMLISWC